MRTYVLIAVVLAALIVPWGIFAAIFYLEGGGTNPDSIEVRSVRWVFTGCENTTVVADAAAGSSGHRLGFSFDLASSPLCTYESASSGTQNFSVAYSNLPFVEPGGPTYLVVALETPDRPYYGNLTIEVAAIAGDSPASTATP
jgi:hypothetical protein